MKKVEEVLEGLREEERRLSVELSGVRRAIAALEEVIGISPAPGVERTEGSAGEQSPPPPGAGVPAPVEPPGPYATAGFYEAVAACLSEAGEPKTAREIAEALQAGGYPTRARNFQATVRTMLHRSLTAQRYGIHVAAPGGRWFTRE